MAKIGIDCKLYRNTGSYGSPAWSEITKVKDVTLNLDKNEIDVSTREAVWTAIRGGLKNGSLDVSYQAVAADTVLDALITSFMSNTAIEFAVMDGAIATSGSKGLRASMEVMTMPREEQLQGAVAYNFTMKVTYSANAPTWFTVGS